jgi:hypothetical protein
LIYATEVDETDVTAHRRKFMGVTYVKEPSGLYVIRMSGIFTDQDRKGVENFGRETIDRSGKVKVIVLAEGFSGWAKEGDWGDMTFMIEYDPCIEKIAVVAGEQWRDKMLMYLGAGLRKAAVEFFAMGHEDKARAWLQ